MSPAFGGHSPFGGGFHSRPLLTALLLLASLSLLVVGVDRNYFLSPMLAQTKAFFFSAQFLYFFFCGCLLCRLRLSDKTFGFLVCLFAFVYLLLFYLKPLDMLRMEGDNICQIAYWNILFQHRFAGAIGVAFTKPGQMLLLGPLYQLSLYGGAVVFKAGLCLAFAACIWSLVMIATDIGGRLAGAIAFPVTVWCLLVEFLSGSAVIFLIPTLFSGLWFYFYRPRHRTLGRLLLALSLQFHVQVIPVLAVVWLILLAKRDWPELKRFTLYLLISALFWLAIIYWVQGALARLNSGAAVGYIGPAEGLPDNSLRYMWDIFRKGLQQSNFRLLFVLGGIGMLGAFAYGFGAYLTVFFIMLLLILNVVFLGGTFNLERYCAPFYAFSCAVGVGALVRFARGAGLTLFGKISLGLSLVALILAVDFSALNRFNAVVFGGEQSYFTHDFVAQAQRLLADPLFQRPVGLLTEDDILSPLVVLAPQRFSSLAALQYFNVAKEPVRRALLAKTDYLWIALQQEHDYYYLFHLPDPSWENDPFRHMILQIIDDNRPAVMYGFRFTPVACDQVRLILKVEAAGTLP